MPIAHIFITTKRHSVAEYWGGDVFYRNISSRVARSLCPKYKDWYWLLLKLQNSWPWSHGDGATWNLLAISNPMITTCTTCFFVTNLHFKTPCLCVCVCACIFRTILTERSNYFRTRFVFPYNEHAFWSLWGKNWNLAHNLGECQYSNSDLFIFILLLS